MKQNIHPDEALALVLADVGALPEETIGLGQALGRVLARALPARLDSPPFDKSAMDGYALAGPATETGHAVLETLAAGSVSARRLAPGEAIRIMTGAPIPAGADRVLRFEWAELRGGRVFAAQDESTANIIRQGENLRAGQPLITPRRLAAQDIGLLASSGYAEVPVRLRPRVGVLSTGDEIQAAGEALLPGRIWDSNGPQLLAQAAEAGAETTWYGMAPDRPEALREVLVQAMAENDVVVVSGGVSLGDFDHVPAALAAAGAVGRFHQLSMRPGKPTWHGVRPGHGQDATPGTSGAPQEKAGISGRPCRAFGLPGNPVSTYVNFLVFVRPLLEVLTGMDGKPRLVRGTMAADLRRKNSTVVEYRPVRLEAGLIHPVEYHGSSMLNGLAEANALVRLELGCAVLAAGEAVDVRPIRP